MIYESNLENLAKGRYSSQGEKRIADFLTNRGIDFRYEKPVLVSDSGKPKIWYPDFFLPEFALHLEYFGINGNSDYNKRSRHKESVYKTNGLDVISIYPGHFEEDWQGCIAEDIKDVLDRRVTRYREMFRE